VRAPVAAPPAVASGSRFAGLDDEVEAAYTQGAFYAEARAVAIAAAKVALAAEVIRPPCPLPANFRSGHCAMQAFWHTFPEHARPKASVIIAESYELLLTKLADARYSRQQVDDYILKGFYDSDCSASIIELLAAYYRRNVTIMKISGEDTVQIVVSAGFDSPMHYFA